MAQGFQIPPVPEFQPDAELGASLAARWRTRLADFEMFLTASEIINATRKCVLLLYLAGSRVREIFQHIQDVGNADDYDTAKTKLTTHFEPQNNRRYDVYRFRETKQEQRETLDQYHTLLRAPSLHANFKIWNSRSNSKLLLVVFPREFVEGGYVTLPIIVHKCYWMVDVKK